MRKVIFKDFGFPFIYTKKKKGIENVCVYDFLCVSINLCILFSTVKISYSGVHIQ